MKKKFKNKTCVVIPCYKVSNKILDVLNSKYLKIIDQIIIIDDKCPEKTGKMIKQKFKDNQKIKVLFNKKNQGVGGATITGFRYALKNNFKVVIKIDGDGQHKLHILNKLILLLSRKTDFCKGYRNLNFNSYLKHNMPFIRLLGAIGLTLLTRFNSGNYNIKDACHGLIGFKCYFLKKINLDKIKKNYLFEQDIIFEVIKSNGNIKHVRNEVIYNNETSSLNPLSSIIPFLFFHLKKFFSP